MSGKPGGLIITRRAAMAGLACLPLWGTSGLASDSGSSLSMQIAQAFAALRNAPVPQDVVDRMIWTVVDNVAVLSFGAGLEASERFIQAVANRQGDPASSIIGTGAHAPVELAAAANAFLIHCSEIDDTDLSAQLRASSIIMSSALAMAEAQDVTGMTFIRAAALGYTLQRRLAACFGLLQFRGWMSSGVWGPPCAAAMAAFLMDLPADRIAAAMAIAGSDSGGLFQYYYDQTEEKRLIVARAARSAIESARLAAAGESGAAHILEGQAGLFALFGGNAVPACRDRILADLQSMEGPLFIHPKFYAASHSIIPTLDAIALELPAGVAPEDIERFTVFGDSDWAGVLADKVNAFVPPASLVGAMLNFSFVVALFIVRRSVMPADYGPGMADPRVLALAARGRFQTVPSGTPLAVEFQTRSGRSFRIQSRAPGPNEPAPLDAQARLRKFEQLTGSRVGEAGRGRLLQLCRQLPETVSMRQWVASATRIIGPGGRRTP
jgi:2-methylcitrate dehydratase PrpD